VVVEGPRRFPATSGMGAGDSKTCPNFRVWQMAIPVQNATTRRFRSGPKMSENAQFEGRVYFSTKHLHPFPYNPSNPHFGTFQCKTIIERVLHKSHVNGATKLKLYIGIGKYLGCINIFPLGDVRGAQGPLM